MLVALHCIAGKWEAAQKVARGYLPQAELQRFYSRRAREFEAAQQWKDAEKAYLAAGEVDMAVNMYKKNKMWENMLRLVQQHRKEGLQQAHLLVAQVGGRVGEVSLQLFACSSYSWNAEVFGPASCEAYDQRRAGLVAQAGTPAAWPASTACAGKKHTCTELHTHPVQALQGEGAFREAERHFCDAKEWKAAVAMYRTQGAWEDALRVAKVYGGLGAANQVRGWLLAVHLMFVTDGALCSRTAEQQHAA